MFAFRRSDGQVSASEVPLVLLSAHTSVQSHSLKGDLKPSPKGWPSDPQRLRTKLTDVALDAAFDLVFIALSMLFLVFGFIVKRYDQTPVTDHPVLTQDLVEATKYVSWAIASYLGLTLMVPPRVRQCFQSYSQQLLAAL